MNPFDLPPDATVADLIRADLARPPEIRKADESDHPHDSHDLHHAHDHTPEAPPTTWTVFPINPSDPIAFFGRGTYLVLKRPAQPVAAVYLNEESGWRFVGLLGQCELPESFPRIEFTQGVEQMAVVPADGTQPSIGTAPWEPNLKIVDAGPPKPPTGLRIGS